MGRNSSHRLGHIMMPKVRATLHGRQGAEAAVGVVMSAHGWVAGRRRRQGAQAEVFSQAQQAISYVAPAFPKHTCQSCRLSVTAAERCPPPALHNGDMMVTR